MAKHGILDRVYGSRNLDDLREAYDSWAATYDSTVSGDYRYRGHEIVVDRVRPHLPDAAAILDAGAGSGMVGLSAFRAGFVNVDAMDLSVGMLEVAKERGVYRDVRTGVLGEPLDYPDNAYDAVLSSGRLHARTCTTFVLRRADPDREAGRPCLFHASSRPDAAGVSREVRRTFRSRLVGRDFGE